LNKEKEKMSNLNRKNKRINSVPKAGNLRIALPYSTK